MAVYKVIGFNENSGQLIIEFAIGMLPLAVDVPIKDGLYITGEELDNFIQGFIPVEHITRSEIINAGIPNASELKKLVSDSDIALPTVLTPEQVQADENAKMWADLKFEQDVAAVLVKLGVLQDDPTKIPVSAQ